MNRSLKRLKERGLIETRYRERSIVLTPEGVAIAKALSRRAAQ
jgi:Mn-dependent DtxR family transcriptional regulator